ncbi:MAG TPA: hypothetical protein VJ739_12860 [Gemmataceae bacterium]|nr:hypothetical protein [Gemmataceae bacterium]
MAAIVGLLTALAPLLARLLDKKRQAARAEEPEGLSRPGVRRWPAAAPQAVLEVEPVAVADVYAEPSRLDPRQVERARALVRPPAVALLAAGIVGLLFNLVVAGFGYVDEFVTPLSTSTVERRNVAEARAHAGPSPYAGAENAQGEGGPERATAVMTIVVLLSFSVPCAMAIWAGVNMIRLRSYWLSVAGSIAIMPGACFFCLVGLPVGIWSLVVLFRPDVSSSFG